MLKKQIYENIEKKLCNLIKSLFVVVLLKRKSHNKEIKREPENERRENERSQSRDKKAITADSAPDPLANASTEIMHLYSGDLTPLFSP